MSPSTDPPRNKKVKFVYDYMGRRVRKDVFYYAGGWPQDDDPDERWHFVYDGWNVVMMLDGLNSNATTRKYTWGLDLSGTIHGAGGIGGLLAVEETQGTYQGTYWFFYDGNGDVGQLVKTVKDGQGNITGVESTLAAHYEYDPYGNLIDSSGPYKDANPFRFSTKWFDDETGLGYWGIRYYDRRTGRWTSEDPIGELGGFNLYVFVSNAAIGHVDPLGFAEQIENMGTVWHHQLCRDKNTKLVARFQAAGITDEVRNSMKYGWEMPSGAHVGELGIHPEWEQEWWHFFDELEGKGLKGNPAMVDAQLAKMRAMPLFAERFKLGNEATMSYAKWQKTIAALAKARRVSRTGRAVRFATRAGKVVAVAGIVLSCVNVALAIEEKGVVEGVTDIVEEEIYTDIPVLTWGPEVGKLIIRAAGGVEPMPPSPPRPSPFPPPSPPLPPNLPSPSSPVGGVR